MHVSCYLKITNWRVIYVVAGPKGIRELAKR